MGYSFLTDTNGISTKRHGVGVGGETWLYDHRHLCSFSSKNEDISQQPGKIERVTRLWFYPQTCYSHSIELKTAQTAPELSLLFLSLSQRTLDAPSPTNIFLLGERRTSLTHFPMITPRDPTEIGSPVVRRERFGATGYQMIFPTK